MEGGRGKQELIGEGEEQETGLLVADVLDLFVLNSAR